jgi:hypothetical protein
MNFSYINSLRTTPVSSSVLLIDENLCASVSLDVLNTSLSALGRLLDTVKSNTSAVQNLYSVFQANSSVWLANMNYIASWQDNWISTSASVSALSATEWVKTTSLVCPVPQYWEDWFVSAYPTYTGLSGIVPKNTIANQQAAIDGWLNVSFPATNFVTGQILVIQLPILQTVSYNFILDQKYKTKCDEYGPMIGSATPNYCATNIATGDPVGTNYFGVKCTEHASTAGATCAVLWPDGGLAFVPYVYSCSKDSVNTGAFADAITPLGCRPYLPTANADLVSYNNYQPLSNGQIKHVQYIASGSSYPGANPSVTPFYPPAGSNFSDFYKERFIATVLTFKVQATPVGNSLYWQIIS